MVKSLARLSLALTLSGMAVATAGSLTLALTTSTENSGLFAYLLPKFTADTGITVRVLAQGTGKAMDTARRGDADVLLVHDPISEQEFVDQGFGVERIPVMYNDFVLIGPSTDPSNIGKASRATQAPQRVNATGHLFVSRGDRSGTHAAERRLWKAAGLEPSSTWYRATGSGMGATLNTASALNAYTLADRGTWVSFKNKKTLRILFAGDPAMHNPYSVIVVNPKRHPHTNFADADQFANWLTSARGQAAIAEFRVDDQAVFFVNVNR